MGEVVDINHDFTANTLSIPQKISVAWYTLIGESKILGKQKKDEVDKEQKLINATIDNLREGLLAAVTFHLQENGTLAQHNQEAVEVLLAIDRRHKDILSRVLASNVFNVFETKLISLDNDIVNSFGSDIPIIVSFKQKEIMV